MTDKQHTFETCAVDDRKQQLEPHPCPHADERPGLHGVGVHHLTWAECVDYERRRHEHGLQTFRCWGCGHERKLTEAEWDRSHDHYNEEGYFCGEYEGTEERLPDRCPECGEHPKGFAQIDGTRYCHGEGPAVTCYMKASGRQGRLQPDVIADAQHDMRPAPPEVQTPDSGGSTSYANTPVESRQTQASRGMNHAVSQASTSPNRKERFRKPRLAITPTDLSGHIDRQIRDHAADYEKLADIPPESSGNTSTDSGKTYKPSPEMYISGRESALASHYEDCPSCLCEIRAERDAMAARIDSLKDGLAHAATVIGRDGSAEDYNYVVARLKEEGFDD